MAIVATRTALRRATAARHRLEARRARTDTRAWVVKRRERTRQLIELGGLIAKAGLIELTDDDRAVILGALIEMAARLRTEQGIGTLEIWRRRGQRAFASESRTVDETPSRQGGPQPKLPIA
ncbi:conjugal transfer protein TraD [Sphingomonas sp. RT2P30]|uniref:conjugal transfer protein TraD n=1 Tax=Parasphingomonas halimpatiens TaxID=3096162 RepID=UPI002FCA56D7